MSGESEKSSTFEMICGLTLAILAAVLAITDLGAGKYGDDEIIAHNQKANAFEWYQAKGIKQSLVEGQRDLLRILLDSRVIPPDAEGKMGNLLSSLEADIVRYRKERKEILPWLESGRAGELGSRGRRQAGSGQGGQGVGSGKRLHSALPGTPSTSPLSSCRSAW
jgi:hypothetical protein